MLSYASIRACFFTNDEGCCMKKRFISLKSLGVSLAGLVVAYSGNVFASGFQLLESNGVSTGDYNAGGAAIAEDASTAYYNPAGLVRIPNQQLVLSADSLFSEMKLKGKNTWQLNLTDPIAIATTNSILTGRTATQSGSANGGGYFVIPAFHYAAPVSDQIFFGLSTTVPFGLETNYGENSFLNYAATKTAIEVVDVSPSLAFKINDQFSIGAGFDAEYLDATFDSMVGLPTRKGYSPYAYNTRSHNEASGWGYGWHTGILYQLSQNTRLGLAYHSKVSFTVDGTSKLSGPVAGGPTSLMQPKSSELSNSMLSSDVTLPATTMLSLYQKINNAWAVMSSVSYTEWGVLNTLTLQNVQAVNDLLGPKRITVSLPQGYRNTWRFGVGASYQPCTQWLFRAGVGYDQTPTVNQYRDMRLPDSDRYATAIGAHYQATKAVGVDLGWTHVFFKDTNINVSQILGNQQTTINAKANSSVDIIGLQLTWDIV